MYSSFQISIYSVTNIFNHVPSYSWFLFPISYQAMGSFQSTFYMHPYSSFSSILKYSGYHSAMKILFLWHHLCTYIYLLSSADTISQVHIFPAFWLGLPTEAVLPSSLVWAKTPPMVDSKGQDNRTYLRKTIMHSCHSCSWLSLTPWWFIPFSFWTKSEIVAI